MTYCNSNSSSTSLLSNNTKIQALESTLHQSLTYFREVLQDFEHLHVESENYKTQFQLQKEKCDSKTCRGSDELKKDIEYKNNMLQSLGTILTRLYETKDFSLFNEVFQIIGSEINIPKIVIKVTPKSQKSNESAGELNDETLNEIEGTPTGRTSPIIHTKISRNSTTAKASDFRDKKKCPDTWGTPEKKTIKLTFIQKATTPTRSKPGGRLKQARLNLVKVKQPNIVDLTCSPEFAGGLRTARTENDVAQTQIKRELVDSDDTILPSPTSGPDPLTLFRSHSVSKLSPFKKPQLSLKPKKDKSRLQFEDVDKSTGINNDVNSMEESINILQHLHMRYEESPKKPLVQKAEPLNDDTTYCENMSISLLQNGNNLNEQEKHCSPPKRPLAENKNITNTPPKVSGETIYHRASGAVSDKRCVQELVEPLYKEPALRKKAEKQALPGWCCDDCQKFYGALYRDDPVMMARKIEECSKHRGRHNPVRPRTPPNFWNPRWHVPEDTEELNRMNNAV